MYMGLCYIRFDSVSGLFKDASIQTRRSKSQGLIKRCDPAQGNPKSQDLGGTADAG
jgi:hypothetical protein